MHRHVHSLQGIRLDVVLAGNDAHNLISYVIQAAGWLDARWSFVALAIGMKSPEFTQCHYDNTTSLLNPYKGLSLMSLIRVDFRVLGYRGLGLISLEPRTD
jgi:hypothetical protein